MFAQLTDFTHLMNNPMKLSMSLKEVTGKMAGTWMQGLNFQQDFMFTDGQLSSVNQDISVNKKTKQPDNLSIDKIESVTPITNFSAKTFFDFSLQGSGISSGISTVINVVSAEAFGGRFEFVQAKWPIQAGHSVDVQLTSIDLEKLLELDKQQGIVVTGKISGHLPLFFDGKKVLIEDGELHNVSNGIIQVMNNPAVAELKASSTELKLAFDALQNLHYHELTSTVSMADDGYMLLETAIKGRNPDLDNDVNLNLNLNYDLLGLLESFDITGQIEKKVVNYSKKKK